MREILFRGKRIDNSQWVEGDLLRTKFYPDDSEHSLIFTATVEFPRSEFGGANEISPESVGQFTGLTDKNGKRIFEGDIVDCWSEGVNAQGTVQQRRDGLWIIFPAWQKTIMWGLCPDEYSNTSVEVIGNIHDNPELIAEVEG